MSIQRPRLLVIDDDPFFRDLLAFILQRDFIVSTAVDGREGYLQAVAHPPDAVILALQMTAWSGPQTLAAFRANARFNRLPILALSTNNTQAGLIEAIGSGADSFLPKQNVTRAAIQARLRTALFGRDTAAARPGGAGNTHWPEGSSSDSSPPPPNA